VPTPVSSAKAREIIAAAIATKNVALNVSDP